MKNVDEKYQAQEIQPKRLTITHKHNAEFGNKICATTALIMETNIK